MTTASTDYLPRRLDTTDRAIVKAPRDRDQMVHVHRQRVADGISALFEEVNQLATRLSPVLVYDEQTDERAGSPTVMDQAAPQSDIAGHLDGFANDINLVHRQLRDLLRRLDI